MMQNNSDSKESRHHTRTALNLPATLRLGNAAHAVWVQDISLKGVLISIPIELAAPIELQNAGQLAILSDPEQVVLVELNIRIIRKQPDLIGATWAIIDLDNLTRLRALLNAHLADITLIERELAELVH